MRQFGWDKYGVIILCLIVVCQLGAVEVGDSEQDVLAEFGKPTSRSSVGQKEIITFDGLKVWLVAGKVSRVDDPNASRMRRGNDSWQAAAEGSRDSHSAPVRIRSLQVLDLPTPVQSELREQPYSCLKAWVNNQGEVAYCLHYSQGGSGIYQGSRKLIEPNTREFRTTNHTSISMNNKGHVASVYHQRYMKEGKEDRELTGTRLYINDRELIREHQLVGIDGVDERLLYDDIHSAVITDNNEVFVNARLDRRSDPYKPVPVGTRDIGFSAIIKFSLSASGKVVGEPVVVRRPFKANVNSVIAKMSLGARRPGEWDVNTSGKILMKHYFNGEGSANRFYISLLDNKKVFKQGDVDTETGQRLNILDAVDLNGAGDWAGLVMVVGGHHAGEWILKNGKKIMRVGDQLPNGRTLKSFEGKIQIDDSGRVYWCGLWDAEGGRRGRAIFRDDVLLIEDGDSRYAEEEISLYGHAFDVSDNGKHLVFRSQNKAYHLRF